MLLAPRRLRVEKDLITRIFRRLKGNGRLRVSVGQEVTPSEIIGTSLISPGFRTLNLATLLNIKPADVGKYLKRSLGQRIYKGELLAYRPKNLFNSEKTVTAPADGLIDFLNPSSGEIRLSFLTQKVDLPAAVYGIVEAVDNLHGYALIKTSVNRIHGLFGTGKPRDGILHLLSSREDLITDAKISIKLMDHILVGGSLVYKETISAAISLGVSGIITGGINARDYKSMAGGKLVFPKKLENDVGISIIVTEGFGSIPIGEDIFEILTDYHGKFVLIDGNQAVLDLPAYESACLPKVRKTKLPSVSEFLTARSQYQAEMIEVKEGQQIRIVGSSYAGQQGKIIALDRSDSLLPSGIRAYLCTIETRRRKIQLPMLNIEIL